MKSDYAALERRMTANEHAWLEQMFSLIGKGDRREWWRVPSLEMSMFFSVGGRMLEEQRRLNPKAKFAALCRPIASELNMDFETVVKRFHDFGAASKRDLEEFSMDSALVDCSLRRSNAKPAKEQADAGDDS